MKNSFYYKTLFMDNICKFSVGQIIQHILFDYRGVIVDIDSNFKGTEKWYREVAKSSPPKDKPWYNVLVDNTFSTTYVAERNIVEAISKEPIKHPLINEYFNGFEKGFYKINYC